MRHYGFLPRIRASSYYGNVPDHFSARSVPSSRNYQHTTDKELRS